MKCAVQCICEMPKKKERKLNIMKNICCHINIDDAEIYNFQAFIDKMKER